MKKILSVALALVLTAALFAGCSANPAGNGAPGPAQTGRTVMADSLANQTISTKELKAPKYVFLFIGDGMSFPQFQSAPDYLGALADGDYMQAVPSLDDNQGAVLDGPVLLNFMDFEAAGSVVTYDSNSFAPDSASTATVSYETITEKVHNQLGMKVGVISSVNLNHAAPAAFYAHQASRSSYYEIGEELVSSGFEYFAGGGLLKPTGSNNDKTDLYALAKQAGYTVVKTQAEAEKVTDGPVILIDEHLADSSAMAYELGLLKTAYEKSVNEKDTGMAAQEEYVAYGTYEPLTVTITHILNNKSGVSFSSFSSYSHTGLPVAVFAHGVNAEQFNGYYDNTDIYNKLAAMLAVK